MRDGGLSMRTILRTWPNATLAQQTFILDKMHSFVQWVVRVQNQPDPHNIDVRTEPKFNLPNGDVFTGSWCRPQTDGPAIRSTTLLLFAQHLLASGAVGRTYVQQYLWTGNNQALNGGIIAYDLDWVVDNWSSVPSCDLWEEIISSSIFWNLVHFKLAMQIGSEFASTMGDSARATKYAAEVAKIDAAIQQHWNGQFLYETTTNGRLVDSAVLGGLKIAFELHRDIEWPFGDPRSDQVAHTVHHYANAFFNAYSINQKLITTPGLLVGRYLGDTYGGGNPWILSTAQLASVLFEVAFDLRQNGTVSSTALATWNNVLDSSLQASDAKSLANSLISAGDGVMQRLDALVKSYSYQLSEQLDKASGVELSATNLTWSYAEVLNAVSIRARL
jgi:glucoamylase